MALSASSLQSIPRSLSFVGVSLSKTLLLVELSLLGQLVFVQTSLFDAEPSLNDDLQILDRFNREVRGIANFSQLDGVPSCSGASDSVSAFLPALFSILEALGLEATFFKFGHDFFLLLLLGASSEVGL
jgi:hypothetical protein